MCIAVTGGIAEGKSTVLGYLAEMGYSTLSSDVLAHECFKEAAVQERLSALLGLPAPVSRDVLRERISATPGVRRAVNRIMHPVVLSSILSSGADFVEIPLLIETCMQTAFDGVWVVTCGPEEQLRRLKLRDPGGTFTSLLKSQFSSDIKTLFADVLVRTNNDPETVKCFVRNAARSAFDSDCAL